MKSCVFYESGTSRMVCSLRLEDAPAVGDTIVLPPADMTWRVEHRTFRPSVDQGGPRVTREVVEVWVANVA